MIKHLSIRKTDKTKNNYELALLLKLKKMLNTFFYYCELKSKFYVYVCIFG